MPDPAKLELLTRTADDEGFHLVEIDSNYVYWSFKPQRLPQTEWELTPQPFGADGARNYVLKSLRQERYLLLDSKEFFLWECFDGRHSLEEIARAFHISNGAFDYSLIRQLLTKLYGCGLIETNNITDLQPSLAGAQPYLWTRHLTSGLRTLRRISFKIPDADRLCSIIYRRGGFLLFHPIAFWLSVTIAVIAFVLAVRLAPHAGNFASHLKAQPFLITGAMLVTLLLVSMLHVLFHALACKAHGRRVREMGFFLLQGVLPTWYADVTDIFMSSRRARIMVDLAGPMVEVVLGSFAIVGAHGASAGFGQALLFGIGVMLWESALINLYPFNFLEMDGYNILADLLAVPMLRQQALALIPNLAQRLRSVKTVERAEWLQLGYLALCLVSVLLYVIAHLDAVGSLLHFSQ
jgi:putative peptide zinc metalloprotease protein